MNKNKEGGVALVTGVSRVTSRRNERENAARDDWIYCRDTKCRCASEGRAVQVNGTGSSGRVDVSENSIARVRKQDSLQRSRGLTLTKTFVVEEEKSFVMPGAETAFTEFR